MGAMDEIMKGKIGLWTGGVEDAGDFVGRAVEEESCEIASVDEAR